MLQDLTAKSLAGVFTVYDILPSASETTLTYMGIETTWIHKQLLS